MKDSNTNQLFTSSPAIHLAGDEIHLWCASLQQPDDVVANFAELLAQDEIARAQRFYFAKDRAHYIVGRGLLRRFLGKYLGLNPAWVELRYGPFGKPALKTGEINHTLQFNLAHSNGLALYAFCWNQELGVDIEHIRPMEEDDFASQVFAASESAYIAALTGEQKRRAFFKIWTCKEAFFKASGEGLSKPIDQAEIAISPEETASLVSIAGDREQAAGWQLKTFQPGSQYLAALAFHGAETAIRYRELDRYWV